MRLERIFWAVGLILGIHLRSLWYEVAAIPTQSALSYHAAASVTASPMIIY